MKNNGDHDAVSLPKNSIVKKNRTRIVRIAFFILGLTVILSNVLPAQFFEGIGIGKTVQEQYLVRANVAYSPVDSLYNRLDIYVPKDTMQAVPAFIWFHGGGWSRGTKDSSRDYLAMFLEMGWVVVNVNYRLAPAFPAPAAVEDGRCALRWVTNHADELRIDRDRIVLSGGSAGGHLALMAGMLDDGSSFDKACPGTAHLHAAAIINFNGIVDVRDLLEGSHMRMFAVRWMGDHPNRDSMATAVSPITYLRRGIPPILSIHGDADPTVPYEHTVQFHSELSKAGATHELMTMRSNEHGKYSVQERESIKIKVREFLNKCGIVKGL